MKDREGESERERKREREREREREITKRLITISQAARVVKESSINYRSPLMQTKHTK